MHGKGTDLGLFALRLGLGAVMVAAGLGKCFGILGGHGIEAFAEGPIATMGFPQDEILGLPTNQLVAWLVGIGELGGGAGLILGILTRFSAFWLTVIMGGTVYYLISAGTLVWDQPGTWNMNAACLGLSIGILFLGPGGWALIPGRGIRRARHVE